MRLGQSAILFCLIAAPAWARTYHYSWWSDNPRPYLEAIQKVNAAAPIKLGPDQRVRAGIVTHHFLASGLMVQFFAALGTSPETIILIGPNHFHHGSANISFSSLPWKTPFGVIATNLDIVHQLMAATNLPEDPEAFTGEHSVGVLIPFLKYYFPRSRVVPVLIDVNARENDLRELRPLLARFLANPQLLVVLSMDFFHDSVVSIADSRDRATQQAILELDADKVSELNVDCLRGLWLLLASLRDLGQVKVQFNEHTNSAQLTGNPHQSNVTSYFTMYFIK